MPISQKIIDLVSSADVTPEEKDLMRDILEIEDKGDHRWKSTYSTLIKEFIKEQEKKEGVD